MIGRNCSTDEILAEAGQAARQDRVCAESYAGDESPAISGISNGWSEEEFLKYRHVLHYRDLFQQKLAYVRGFLDAVGRREVWEGRNLGFLTTTIDANQFYDEGSAGRCSAYDPFNRIGDSVLVGPNHRYTIQPLEFGRCAAVMAVITLAMMMMMVVAAMRTRGAD